MSLSIFFKEKLNTRETALHPAATSYGINNPNDLRFLRSVDILILIPSSFFLTKYLFFSSASNRKCSNRRLTAMYANSFDVSFFFTISVVPKVVVPKVS